MSAQQKRRGSRFLIARFFSGLLLLVGGLFIGTLHFTKLAHISWINKSESLDGLSLLLLFIVVVFSTVSYLTVNRLKRKLNRNYIGSNAAARVDELVTEARMRTRMETELLMAKTVQSTFFPNAHATLGPLEISGHFELASECGGDWWYYRDLGETVNIFIGDTTGHGVSAALMTSAVYATCFCADRQGNLSPKDYLSLINDTLFSTAKGKLMMTFFMAQIHKNSGRMKYAMAGHEPPMLLRGSTQNISMKCYHYLNEVNGPRLGESPGVQFKEIEIGLNGGDRLFLFTDGLYAASSGKGQELGLRRMHKIVAKALTEKNDTQKTLELIVDEIQQWRSGAALHDDLTAIVMKFGA